MMSPKTEMMRSCREHEWVGLYYIWNKLSSLFCLKKPTQLTLRNSVVLKYEVTHWDWYFNDPIMENILPVFLWHHNPLICSWSTKKLNTHTWLEARCTKQRVWSSLSKFMSKSQNSHDSLTLNCINSRMCVSRCEWVCVCWMHSTIGWMHSMLRS